MVVLKNWVIIKATNPMPAIFAMDTFLAETLRHASVVKSTIKQPEMMAAVMYGLLMANALEGIIMKAMSSSG